MMPKKVELMIIDPQNSFCHVVDDDDQQKLHDGELCVPGAWEDMERLAQFVKDKGNLLNDIKIYRS